VGQSYQPFPEGDAQWSEFTTALYCCGPGSNTVECQRIYYFDSDTVINGLTYHIILFDEACVTTYFWDPWPPWNTGRIGALGGYLRQDTTDRRVYQWTASLGDTLLYDFNMSLGAYPLTSMLTAPLNIIEIDSVLLGDGWHKRWILDATDFNLTPYTVIEGIGSTFGLFGPMYPPFEASQDLVCFTKDSTLIYEWSQMIGNIGCDLSVGTRPLAQPYQASSIHPNPFNEYITLELSDAEPVRFKLLNASGSIAFTGTTTGTIDTRTLHAGHYILILTGPDGSPILQRNVIKL
jgi:hypothetical protein